MTRFIPPNELARQYRLLRDGLATRAREVIEGSQYVLGPECAAFAAEFAGYCGVACCFGVANGTDAIELALHAVVVTHLYGRLGDVEVIGDICRALGAGGE